MCLTASNEKIVEFIIGEERVQANRKMIMSESRFFKKALSDPEHNGHSVVLSDTTATVFATFVKLLEGSKDCINRDNIHELMALANSIECDFLMVKCVEYFAALSEDDRFYLSILSLEKAVEMKEGKDKDTVKANLARVFRSEFVVRNKDSVISLSFEMKSSILEFLIDDVSTMIVRDDKTDRKIKKLEQRSTILETQLRKALDDLKASKDDKKATNDYQTELTKLKKKLDQSEKKTKHQEVEMEKMRKKLASENRKYEMLQKDLKDCERKYEESVFIFQAAKIQFDNCVEFEKKKFEDRLEQLMQCATEEAKAVKKLREKERYEFKETLTNMQETIDHLQEENQAKSKVLLTNVGTSTDDLAPVTSSIVSQFNPECYRINNNLKSIWSDNVSQPSYFVDRSPAFNGFEWKKQKSVWSNDLFM